MRTFLSLNKIFGCVLMHGDFMGQESHLVNTRSKQFHVVNLDFLKGSSLKGATFVIEIDGNAHKNV